MAAAAAGDAGAGGAVGAHQEAGDARAGPAVRPEPHDLTRRGLDPKGDDPGGRCGRMTPEAGSASLGS